MRDETWEDRLEVAAAWLRCENITTTGISSDVAQKSIDLIRTGPEVGITVGNQMLCFDDITRSWYPPYSLYFWQKSLNRGEYAVLKLSLYRNDTRACLNAMRDYVTCLAGNLTEDALQRERESIMQQENASKDLYAAYKFYSPIYHERMEESLCEAEKKRKKSLKSLENVCADFPLLQLEMNRALAQACMEPLEDLSHLFGGHGSLRQTAEC